MTVTRMATEEKKGNDGDENGDGGEEGEEEKWRYRRVRSKG